jgi:hypothetical protein
LLLRPSSKKGKASGAVKKGAGRGSRTDHPEPETIASPSGANGGDDEFGKVIGRYQGRKNVQTVKVGDPQRVREPMWETAITFTLHTSYFILHTSCRKVAGFVPDDVL